MSAIVNGQVLTAETLQGLLKLIRELSR